MEHPVARAEAQRFIREIALRPDGVRFRAHCLGRMRQRRVDALDVVRILRNAELQRPAYKRDEEWRYAVVGRGLVIVVVLESETLLWAHTVYRPIRRDS
jgi:hypothetical protein